MPSYLSPILITLGSLGLATILGFVIYGYRCLDRVMTNHLPRIIEASLKTAEGVQEVKMCVQDVKTAVQDVKMSNIKTAEGIQEVKMAVLLQDAHETTHFEIVADKLKAADKQRRDA